MKKLYRDTSDQKIAGVCSGIAKYLEIDATVIRLLWVFAVFFVGSGILAYIVCAIVIPEAPADYYYNYYNQQQQNTYYDPNRDYTHPDSDWN